MPVNLDAIPDKAPDIQRPFTFRWVMAGVIIFLIGVGITLWFWQGERTGFKFWFAAICLPVLSWGSLFALRRVGYKLERVGTHSWNKEREALIASETARGQRFAWLVDEYLINALETGEPGDKETQQATLDKSSMINHCLARDGVSTIRHTALPDLGTSKGIFESYVGDISGHAISMLAQLPVTMPCYIAFDLSDNLSELADALFSKIDLPLRRIRNLAGISILDYWLDQHHDIPTAILIISAQIYDVPPQDSGEAITMMLMSNRRLPAVTPSPGIRIHRPQINKLDTLSHALSRAMLWGKLDMTAPLRGWITGGKLSSEEIWSNACTALAPKLTAQRNVNLDTVIGYAGAAAPWQSLILAARQSQTDAEPQMIVVETSSSCHQLCAVTSEKTSGIV
ncbi:hypothetical protein [Edaphovirga cremea]|uniref:hypothetical protein n=1 Tax=Edaphovirga cremea TaxID=2267246 RepID=UPI000DF01B3E|nr:hypothetical protein [Edaphovirga cremea]